MISESTRKRSSSPVRQKRDKERTLGKQLSKALRSVASEHEPESERLWWGPPENLVADASYSLRLALETGNLSPREQRAAQDFIAWEHSTKPSIGICPEQLLSMFVAWNQAGLPQAWAAYVALHTYYWCLDTPADRKRFHGTELPVWPVDKPLSNGRSLLQGAIYWRNRKAVQILRAAGASGTTLNGAARRPRSADIPCCARCGHSIQLDRFSRHVLRGVSFKGLSWL